MYLVAGAIKKNPSHLTSDDVPLAVAQLALFHYLHQLYHHRSEKIHSYHPMPDSTMDNHTDIVSKTMECSNLLVLNDINDHIFIYIGHNITNVYMKC